ncbi:unnamed protein product, partial [Scytosiphon promiscuus]
NGDRQPEDHLFHRFNIESLEVRERIGRFYDALHAYEQIFCPTCHEMWPTDKLPADGGFEGQCDR